MEKHDEFVAQKQVIITLAVLLLIALAGVTWWYINKPLTEEEQLAVLKELAPAPGTPVPSEEERLFTLKSLAPSSAAPQVTDEQKLQALKALKSN